MLTIVFKQVRTHVSYHAFICMHALTMFLQPKYMHRTDSKFESIYACIHTKHKTMEIFRNHTVRSSQRTEFFPIWDADDGKVDTGDVGTGTGGVVSTGEVFSDPAIDAVMCFLKSSTCSADASKVSATSIPVFPAVPAEVSGVAWARCNKVIDTLYIFSLTIRAEI